MKQRNEQIQQELLLQTQQQNLSAQQVIAIRLTELSLEALEQRFEVARMLSQDKVYLDIMKSTGASSATISRVKRMLSDGTGCLREKILHSLEEET